MTAACVQTLDGRLNESLTKYATKIQSKARMVIDRFRYRHEMVKQTKVVVRRLLASDNLGERATPPFLALSLQFLAFSLQFDQRLMPLLAVRQTTFGRASGG